MEYIIKQGERECEYTGKTSAVLIKLVDINGNSSGWLSREALQSADRLLQALEGSQQYNPGVSRMVPHAQPVRQVQQQQTLEYTMDTQFEDDGVGEPVQPIPRVEKKIQSKALQSFEKACVALCQDPPADKNGNQEGVPGFAIRELIKQWKPQFSNPREMYPVIQKFFPSPKEVIDFMLSN